MATTTTNLNATKPGLFAGLTRLGAALGDALTTMTEANSRMREYERLSAKSDAELAKLGLKRDEIVTHVFRDTF